MASIDSMVLVIAKNQLKQNGIFFFGISEKYSFKGRHLTRLIRGGEHGGAEGAIAPPCFKVEGQCPPHFSIPYSTTKYQYYSLTPSSSDSTARSRPVAVHVLSPL